MLCIHSLNGTTSRGSPAVFRMEQGSCLAWHSKASGDLWSSGIYFEFPHSRDINQVWCAPAPRLFNRSQSNDWLLSNSPATKPTLDLRLQPMAAVLICVFRQWGGGESPKSEYNSAVGEIPAFSLLVLVQESVSCLLNPLVEWKKLCACPACDDRYW